MAQQSQEDLLDLWREDEPTSVLEGHTSEAGRLRVEEDRFRDHDFLVVNGNLKYRSILYLLLALSFIIIICPVQDEAKDVFMKISRF